MKQRKFAGYVLLIVFIIVEKKVVDKEFVIIHVFLVTGIGIKYLFSGGK